MVIWLGQQNSENAGVAELADALALGASALACRFKSCHPHHIPWSSKPVILRLWGFSFLPTGAFGGLFGAYYAKKQPKSLLLIAISVVNFS